MFDNPLKFRWVIRYAGPPPEGAVVALRERETGRLYQGLPEEIHSDLEARIGPLRSSDSPLDAGFFVAETGEFLTLPEARTHPRSRPGHGGHHEKS